MRRLCLTVLFLLVATAALAQKPTNPREVQWNDPNDYATMTGWQIAYFLPGAAQPVSPPTDLGKPALTSTGCVTPTSPCLVAAINTMPVPFGMDYVAKIRGVSGTYVSEWSDPSNPFDRVPGKPGGTVIR